MKTILLTLAGLMIFATSCSSQKPKTAVETVQGNQDSVDKTNDYIVRAEKTIDDFEKNIQGLMVDAAKSDKMRGKSRYNEALTVMDRKIAESRRDLADLKASNTRSWETYKGNLDSAADDMQNAFKKGE